MKRFVVRAVPFTAAIFASLAFLAFPVRVSSDPSRAQTSAAAETVACRAMEVHSAEASHIRLVIFHYGDKKDRDKVAQFVVAHAGKAVQFHSADGAWHDATLIRLKSCFGRGLLVFASDSATLAEKAAFTLRPATE
ncbi:MAG: hypothetical protein WCA98_05290 [Candidatus Acidiferrales bacterium]